MTNSTDVHDGPPPRVRRTVARTPRQTATLLFLATLATTLFAGLSQSPQWVALQGVQGLLGFDHAAAFLPWWKQPTVWLQSFAYAGSLLLILFCHEMGHFLAAKKNGVAVSPPYFLPSVPPLGTLGAVIKMEMAETIRSSALLRVAAWGPIAGMVPATIVLMIGLSLSWVEPLPYDRDLVMQMNGGVLMQLLEASFFGTVPEGSDIFLHPVAFAGWAGCFVTALNMLPIGQLDGGHVLYALAPRRARTTAWLTWCLLLVAGFFYVGWWFFALLLRKVIGVEHPPMCRDAGAEGRVRWAGYAAVALFALTFHPTPLEGGGVLVLLDGLRQWIPYVG